MEIKKFNLKICLLATYIMLFIPLGAKQNDRTKFLSPIFRANMSLSGIGLSYELPLKSDILLETEAGLGAGYKINTNFEYHVFLDNPSAYFSLNFKYYYRIKKRQKPQTLNNDFFWGFKAKYISGPIKGGDKTWPTAFLTTNWGIQKRFYKNFSYLFTVGLGMAYDVKEHTDTYVTIFPDLNFKISYAF